MTQLVESPKISSVKTALLLALVLVVLVVAGGAIWWLLMEPRLLSRAVMRDLLLKGVLLWALLFCMALVAWQIVQKGVRNLVLGSWLLPVPPPAEPDEQRVMVEAIQGLRKRYGLFWRRKVRLLLVIGEPAEITAIAPTLASKLWLEGEGTVLLWGGSAQATLDELFAKQWRGLSRWRGVDGVVWALNSSQAGDDAAMGAGVIQLRRLAYSLKWQLPLYLWQVSESLWPQDTREAAPVGCQLPERFTVAMLETALTRLVEPLRREGLAQMNKLMQHDFLLRLSHDLQTGGISRWRHTMAPLAGEFAACVPLRGVWFSQPVPPVRHELDNGWLIDPVWQGLLGEQAYRRWLGWSAPRVGYALVMGLALVWGAGLLLSYVSNRAHMAQVHTSLAALQQSASGDEQLSAFNDFVRELGRLDYRATHGEPWYLRFGLSQNQVLLDKVWPRYVEANNRLIRDPAAANLRHQLNALISLPPGSEQRAERAQEAYEQLKAYLMMARPHRADETFLTKALSNVEPLRGGVSPGLWQALSPNLWQFYGEHLAQHPAWAVEVDARLVAQVRRVLLSQLGQRNAETTRYQQVLDAAADQYPELSLQAMAGDADALALFYTDASVPGVFTRQAWEGQVRQAIDDIAETRREEIDWVLSDNQAEIASELTPDVLRERLTERYFKDYASAWLDVLNGLRWNPANSLDDVIDQLTLMTDVRQSPLIALMNTLAYHAMAGTRSQGVGDSLMTSAQQLIAKDPAPMLDQRVHVPRSPMDATFGPLLALMGKDSEGRVDNERLSLQAFLTRVTRLRLKLQQVSNAPDPQEMTQALAQTVFQGKSADLTQAQSYGSLVAASLGAEWGGIGHTLFVQPLDEAWQRVLQPSAAALNSQWQRAIVREWHSAFAGRYPFAETTSEASLPMLGQMIRADSGRIEQFLRSELSGVLRKEGSQWVADPRHSRGLRVNPQFLAAINQLSHLADVIYTDGGMGLSFELQGKPVRDVVQTTFIFNGARHQYFNQKEFWQRFSWPGRSDHPGVSLSWTSVHAGERLFGDYQGTWGLIRLLEKARVTALDDSDSRYHVVLKAPDGLNLTWNLRTEMGAGPLALLKLRSFTLPQQIFLSAN